MIALVNCEIRIVLFLVCVLLAPLAITNHRTSSLTPRRLYLSATFLVFEITRNNKQVNEIG